MSGSVTRPLDQYPIGILDCDLGIYQKSSYFSLSRAYGHLIFINFFPLLIAGMFIISTVFPRTLEDKHVPLSEEAESTANEDEPTPKPSHCSPEEKKVS